MSRAGHETTDAVRRHLESQLQGVGDQLARAEARLVETESELGNLDAVEVEATWVAACLTDFDKVWDVLTPENRGRLVRAVVQRVEVNETTNEVTVMLTDLGADLPEEPATPALVQDTATP